MKRTSARRRQRLVRRTTIERLIDFERTATRFRATGNVAPEHLYAHFLLEERAGVEVDTATSLRHAAYHPLNNVPVYQRLNLARLRVQRPRFCCMNDNYGANPNPRSVRVVRAFLNRMFPKPSRFEACP